MSSLYSLDHPLGSGQLKAKWANVHIRRLKQSIRRSALGPEITFGRKSELDMPKPKIPNMIYERAFLYELRISPSIERQWGLIVGDILTNLRASLDHIAWALAVKFAEDQGSTLSDADAKRVSFPLRMTPVTQDAFVGGLNWNDVELFPPEAHAVIDELQPYNQDKRPELKLLGVLRELVNEDKHRIVTPVFQEVAFRFKGDQQYMKTRVVEPNKTWFLVPESQVDNLNLEGTFDTVLNVPFLFPDYFPITDFRSIHKLIRYEIIPAFAGFFESSETVRGEGR